MAKRDISTVEVEEAVKSYQELQMWEFVRDLVEDETRKRLVEMAIKANVLDVVKNADAYLRRLEKEAMKMAKVRKSEKTAGDRVRVKNRSAGVRDRSGRR